MSRLAMIDGERLWPWLQLHIQPTTRPSTKIHPTAHSDSHIESDAATNISRQQ